MSDRRCVTCDTPEERIHDERGHERTNICSLTGQCLPCLVESARAYSIRVIVPKRGVLVHASPGRQAPRRSDGLTGRDLAVPVGDRE